MAPTYPGRERRTRSKRIIQKWHVWLVVWLLMVAGILFANFRFLGIGLDHEPVNAEDIGVVDKETRSTPTPSVPSPTPKDSEPTTAPPPTPTPAPTATTAPPPVQRTARVVIYNTTRVANLGARTAEAAKAKGWNVVHVGNIGTAESSSVVYYSAGLQDQAKALAKDLGIARTAPNPRGISLVGLSVLLR